MRRVEKITITDEGRDQGKIFVLTEMPADQGEKWALRALLALLNAGFELPTGVDASSGMAGVAAVGMQAFGKIPFHEAEVLLDEMFQCVKFQPANAKILPQSILPGDASQIEEIKTRISLRVALFNLHTGFFSQEEAPATTSGPTLKLAPG